MSDHTFYSTSNNHHHRELTIVNVAQLVGKAPTKEKRIRVKVRMLLSGTINMGSPTWLDKAYAFVADSHDKVTPSIEFKGYDLHFSADNLFEAEGVKSPRCQMRSFEIHECGDSENPDVAATFTIYTPYSSALWQWLGAFGGENCWCSFTPGVPDASPEPPEGGDKDEEPTEGDDDEAKEIDEDELDPDNETEVGTAVDEPEADTMLMDAIHVFESHGKVSAVELQRVLSMSYVKAAHVIERMEERGMVSKPDANGVRVLNAQGTAPQKSGPKDLAAYHEQVLDAEPPAKKRGRPRKAVDPLTIDAATAF